MSADKLAYRWCLRRESGTEDRGEFTPPALEDAERGYLDGQEFVRRVLTLDLAVEPGYHSFSIECTDGCGLISEMSLIVAPAACYEPPRLTAKDGCGVLRPSSTASAPSATMASETSATCAV